MRPAICKVSDIILVYKHWLGPFAPRIVFQGKAQALGHGGVRVEPENDERIGLGFVQMGLTLDLESLGGRAWVNADKMTMKEWILIPDAFYDDQDLLAEWAARAQSVAPAKKSKGRKAAPAAKKAAPKVGPANKTGASMKTTKKAAPKPARGSKR